MRLYSHREGELTTFPIALIPILLQRPFSTGRNFPCNRKNRTAFNICGRTTLAEKVAPRAKFHLVENRRKTIEEALLYFRNV